MPRQRNKKTQGCQTDYDNWLEHQIHEGVEKIAVKTRSELEDQVTKLKQDIEAKLKQDIEAKLKQDIEAKLKRDIEGKLKREIQTKMKSDIEAKLKTDIETNLIPDTEAKMKLKLEAKLKSDISSTTQELQVKLKISKMNITSIQENYKINLKKETLISD